MNDKIKNIPDEIYLQVDEEFTDFNTDYLNSVTWCIYKINESDIKYIRCENSEEDLRKKINLCKKILYIFKEKIFNKLCHDAVAPNMKICYENMQK